MALAGEIGDVIDVVGTTGAGKGELDATTEKFIALESAEPLETVTGKDPCTTASE